MFNIHAPLEAEAHIKTYVAAMFELNSLSNGYDPYKDLYTFYGYSDPISVQLKFRKNLYSVDIVLCDHSVPTISYCFSEVRMKLKDEYLGK